ncbi:MAG: nucleotidyltransferase family protein [Chitinophagaceae bacterium]|nr:nucleotidyltransferase family protein [Chitinophagaceae bacterium]
MMITEAIILAGGLGTRLRDTVPGLPKSMAPVAGQPFLKYVIAYYRKQGIEKFIFSLGYKHKVIEDFLLKECSDLDYSSVIEEEPLGTGGAIYKAVNEVTSSNVLVLNGDTFFQIDLERLSAFHVSNKSDCTLCLKEMNNTDRYGIVEISADARIQSFKEKRFYETALINGGVYALNADNFLKEKFPQKFSFENDYFEKLYRERRMFGIVQDGYFIDIGIPEDYKKAQQDFKSFA